MCWGSSFTRLSLCSGAGCLLVEDTLTCCPGRGRDCGRGRRLGGRARGRRRAQMLWLTALLCTICLLRRPSSGLRPETILGSDPERSLRYKPGGSRLEHPMQRLLWEVESKAILRHLHRRKRRYQRHRCPGRAPDGGTPNPIFFNETVSVWFGKRCCTLGFSAQVLDRSVLALRTLHYSSIILLIPVVYCVSLKRFLLAFLSWFSHLHSVYYSTNRMLQP